MPYDNTFHKRADASCRTIDIEHMKRCMDGDAYTSLETFAKNNWGADWTQITDNPPDQPNFGLSGCVVAPVPTLTLDDHPPCTSQAANSSVIATQDGSVKIPYDAGISSFTSATVVQAAVMPIQTTVEGDISIPALGDGFDPFSISLTLNNFLLSNDSSRKADTSPTSVEALATKGQQCYAPLNNVTCTAEGYTRFQIASSGYIWFTYNTSRGTPPNTQWAVSIEQVIPDASLRSTYMKVNATTVATRLVAAGDPVCDSQSRFTGGGQTLGGTTPSSSGGTPVYAYVVPVVLVVIIALGGLGFFLWQRRSQRASRTEQQLVEADPVPSFEPTSPSISEVQTESTGAQRYDRWAQKLQRHARADAAPAPVRYPNEKSRPYNS